MTGLDFTVVFANLHHLLIDGLGLTLQLTVVCAQALGYCSERLLHLSDSTDHVGQAR
jgi:hypothetical protein